MTTNNISISSFQCNEYEGESIRMVVTLEEGKVLFVASDIATGILGVKNPYSLTQSVDRRCKAEVVTSFVEEYNPQRYVLVDLEGLRSMVYRARNSKYNRLDFILWAKEKGGN